MFTLAFHVEETPAELRARIADPNQTACVVGDWGTFHCASRMSRPERGATGSNPHTQQETLSLIARLNAPQGVVGAFQKHILSSAESGRRRCLLRQRETVDPPRPLVANVTLAAASVGAPMRTSRGRPEAEQCGGRLTHRRRLRPFLACSDLHRSAALPPASERRDSGCRCIGRFRASRPRRARQRLADLAQHFAFSVRADVVSGRIVVCGRAGVGRFAR